MPIPERLRVSRPAEPEIRRFCALCHRIDDGVNRGQDVSELLAEWNARANRTHDPQEFTTYYGVVSTEEFVEGPLLPKPSWVEDITFGELLAVLEEALAGALPVMQTYYLNLIETNLPGAGAIDLIYWPNEWFKDEAMLHVELTAEQILIYASLRSGRTLAGTPDGVVLPHPVPSGRL